MDSLLDVALALMKEAIESSVVKHPTFGETLASVLRFVMGLDDSLSSNEAQPSLSVASLAVPSLLSPASP